MPEQLELIQDNLARTVRHTPSIKRGDAGMTRFHWSEFSRGPLLPAVGTRYREWVLHQFSIHDYNTLFKSGVAVTAKRLISTPWELTGEPEATEFYQDVLWNACLGQGWDVFLARLIKDYTRYDSGAYVELIGLRDETGALVGPATGINVLDSLRCYPTGDPIHPVIYMDINGTLHLLHFTSVQRIYDQPDSYEAAYDYGECALTRCIAPVQRDILMNRYVELSLDDNPPPGLMLFKNISEDQLRDAFKILDKDRATDFGSKWGNVVRLYGLQTETMPEVESIPYNMVPEKFDYVTYKELNVKEIALGLGVDIQDLWELTGNSLGTATQSEVLERKSKGQLLGTLYKTIERLINQILPKNLSFEFQYQDPDEDQAEADKANTWANIIITLDGKLTADEQRRLLANQVEAVRNVITDESGQLIRLDDSDPQTPEQAAPQLEAPAQTPDEDVIADDRIETEKVLSATQRTFKQQFIDLAMQAQLGQISKVVVRPALRLALIEAGSQAALDGMADGGEPATQMPENLRKELSIWRAEQSRYLKKFVNALFKETFTLDEVQRRADLWVNKSVNTMYYMGLAEAKANARFMWIVDPVKEHCVTCLKLNGQIHRMKDYVRTGLLPQSPKLVCGGYKCGCKLVPSDEPARGRLRAVRFVRRMLDAVAA